MVLNDGALIHHSKSQDEDRKNRLARFATAAGVAWHENMDRLWFRKTKVITVFCPDMNIVYNGRTIQIRRAGPALPLAAVPPFLPPGMSIFVKDLQDNVYTFDVTPSTELEQLKGMIFNRLGIPPGQQRLLFGGMQLDGAKTMEEYNIQKQSTVHLVLRLIGC